MVTTTRSLEPIRVGPGIHVGAGPVGAIVRRALESSVVGMAKRAAGRIPPARGWNQNGSPHTSHGPPRCPFAAQYSCAVMGASCISHSESQ